MVPHIWNQDFKEKKKLKITFLFTQRSSALYWYDLAAAADE